MNNILDDNGSIKSMRFMCNRTNMTYEITGTESTLGDLDHWRDNVSRCIDTIVREDGDKRKWERMDLKKRFTNVKLL